MIHCKEENTSHKFSLYFYLANKEFACLTSCCIIEMCKKKIESNIIEVRQKKRLNIG